MVYSQVKSRLNSLNTEGRPHPSGGDMFGSDCCIHCCLTGCLGAGWVLQVCHYEYFLCFNILNENILFFQIGQRGDARQRYRIKGGSCGDCMSAAFCTPCELTQQAQELALEEEALMGQVQDMHQKA